MARTRAQLVDELEQGKGADRDALNRAIEAEFGLGASRVDYLASPALARSLVPALPPGAVLRAGWDRRTKHPHGSAHFTVEAADGTVLARSEVVGEPHDASNDAQAIAQAEKTLARAIVATALKLRG